MLYVFSFVTVAAKRNTKVVMDLIAILTQILQKLPENSEVVSRVIGSAIEEGEETVSYIEFLRHSNPLLRQRICCFLQLLGRNVPQGLQAIWNLKTRETLEALAYDSIDSVRNVYSIKYVFTNF